MNIKSRGVNKMKKKKLSDASQVVIGIAITLAVWTIGVYMSGMIPWIADFVRVSDGNALLCKFYPVFLIVLCASSGRTRKTIVWSRCMDDSIRTHGRLE